MSDNRKTGIVRDRGLHELDLKFHKVGVSESDPVSVRVENV